MTLKEIAIGMIGAVGVAAWTMIMIVGVVWLFS
jgi:hypothetical protein